MFHSAVYVMKFANIWQCALLYCGKNIAIKVYLPLTHTHTHTYTQNGGKLRDGSPKLALASFGHAFKFGYQRAASQYRSKYYTR